MSTQREAGDRAPALAGLRVIEMSAFVAAPLAGATLAALGADVIRVEPPGGGVDIGRWPLHGEISLYRAGLDQGKRLIELDLKTKAGQESFVKLLRDSGPDGGILLTNLPVADWNSYQRLSAVREDLIMLVITGNRDGTPAVDYTVNAALGFPMITGPQGHEPPVNHVMPAWDATTGLYAAIGILTAERQRRRTGKGQLIELSLSDVGIAISGQLGLLAEATLNPEPRGRYGNYVYGTFGRDFETGDGRFVIVVALTDRQWRSLGAATGLAAEFTELERKLGLDLTREGDRWQAREEISALIAPWIRERTLAQVGVVFNEKRVLWGPYRSFKQFLAEDARATATNPLLVQVEHPELGRYLSPGSPLRFSGSGVPAPRPGPSLGRDTASVAREFGLDEF